MARFNLYVQSWLLLITRKDNPRLRNVELLAMFGFVVWHVSLVAFALPDGWSRLQFVLLSHAVAGILHVQIVLSHFAMDVYHGHRLEKFEDWCTTQIETTMNIDSNWMSHWFHGGLQYQIEHHLFPRVPRHNLGKVAALVKPFCEKHNIPYISVSFMQGNRMVRVCACVRDLLALVLVLTECGCVYTCVDMRGYVWISIYIYIHVCALLRLLLRVRLVWVVFEHRSTCLI